MITVLMDRAMRQRAIAKPNVGVQRTPKAVRCNDWLGTSLRNYFAEASYLGNETTR